MIQSFVGELFSIPQLSPIVKMKPTPAKSNQPEHLPSLAQVEIWFDEINREFFDGKLPRVKIIYSPRMRCAGSYTPSQRIIRLGIKYHELFPEQLRDTLKHEMIHIINPTHDRAFKAEAARIGASRYATHHPTLRRATRYLYTCPACALEYPRRKRLRMAHCGRCAKRDGMQAVNKLVLTHSRSTT